MLKKQDHLLKLTEKLDNIDLKIKFIEKKQKPTKEQEGKIFSNTKKYFDSTKELFKDVNIALKQNKVNPKGKYTSKSLLPEKKFDFSSALENNSKEMSNQITYVAYSENSSKTNEENEIKKYLWKKQNLHKHYPNLL